MRYLKLFVWCCLIWPCVFVSIFLWLLGLVFAMCDAELMDDYPSFAEAFWMGFNGFR